MFAATAIILAGGRSSRMNGCDKARISLADRSLLERNLAWLQRTFAEVLIVSSGARRYDFPQVKLVTDEQPDCGPLMGIYSGLRASSHETNLVMACDMPCVALPLVTLMLSRAHENDVVVPVVNGYYEPLLAVYARRVTPFIKRCLSSGRRKVTSFYRYVRLCEIAPPELTRTDPRLRSFLNINTPHDLAHARRLLQTELLRS